jgi:D-glycero-alpha-D-manno-heptose-7-phosphate kinase
VRIDFAGGWSDVPPYSERVGGAVVNATITMYSYTSLRRRDDGIRIVSADYDSFIEAQDIRQLEYDGNLDLIKAALRRLPVQGGMEITTRCDAPPGSGTGSSAAVGVGLIGLLNYFQLDKLSHHEIAHLANRLEIEELHIKGGKQDQYAAAIGGINFMEFDDPAVSTSRLNVEAGVIYELEKHLLLCYTGQSRLSGDTIAKVVDAYERGDATVTGALNGVRNAAREVKTALINGDLKRFGELLSENWQCQKALHPSITNDTMEELYAVALKNGASGGKACGAGAGGCMLFLCQPDREHLVRRALEAAGGQILDFNFDFQGLQTWATEER